MLVVDPVPKDYSAGGGMKEFYNAIWFSNAPKNVHIGHKVQVWFNEILESYPGQSKAVKVSILPDSTPSSLQIRVTPVKASSI